MKYKGKKYWGVVNEDGELCTYDKKEKAASQTDKYWPYVVELTVTKVFTRETELKEIEK